MQDHKRLMPRASKDAPQGNDMFTQFQCADASKGVNVLAAIASGRVWVWRKEDTSYCAMDAECKYKVSKAWTSKATKPLKWVKVTSDGTRVLCGTGIDFDSVDSAAQGVAFVLRVACDTDGSPALELEHTLDLQGPVHCAPVIARDSRTAYIVVGCDVEIADLVTGTLVSANVGRFNTNSIECASLLEDDKGQVPPILVVARSKNTLECWSMQSFGCAQKEKEITRQGAGISIFDEPLVLVRRKRSKNEGHAIMLEIVLKICNVLEAKSVVQVFDVAAGGQYSASCSNSAMSTILDAQKGKGSEYTVRAISLRDPFTLRGQLGGVRSILRPSSIFVLVAYRSTLVLTDACTGKIIDEAQCDDDDYFEALDASPNGDFVCLGTRKGTLHQWKVTEDNFGRPRLMFCLKECSHAAGAIKLIMYCRNGLVGAINDQQFVIVWDTGAQRLIFGQRPGTLVHSMAYLQSQDGCYELLAYYDSFDSKLVLCRLGKENLQEVLVGENKFRDYWRDFSPVFEFCPNLKLVHKVAHGGNEPVYSCAYPVHEQIPIEESYIMFPREMTKCGCTPVVTSDYTQLYSDYGHFSYNILTVQDPKRLFSVITGAVFWLSDLIYASIFHFYENP